jgi:hypothetical protein
MNTLKTLAFAALLSSMSLVSVAQTTAGFKPAAAHHATHKAPTSKAKSKQVKPKPKVKTVAHSAKKPVAKKSGLTKTSLARKKAAAHKKAASSKHGITVSR